MIIIIIGIDRGKMTIYGSDFQQVNLTPHGGVSPTVRAVGSISRLAFMFLHVRFQRPNYCLTSCQEKQ